MYRYDIWYMIHEIWYMKYDTWCMKYDIWCMHVHIGKLSICRSFQSEPHVGLLSCRVIPSQKLAGIWQFSCCTARPQAAYWQQGHCETSWNFGSWNFGLVKNGVAPNFMDNIMDFPQSKKANFIWFIPGFKRDVFWCKLEINAANSRRSSEPAFSQPYLGIAPCNSSLWKHHEHPIKICGSFSGSN